MQTDGEGFLYPSINFNACSLCNLCERICPSLSSLRNRNEYKPQIKAAWSLNEDVRFHSTSGGIFTEIAQSIIKNNNGYVIGARYTEDQLVEHYIIDTIEDIHLLRQSKYLQSNKTFIYKEIKKLLKNNKTVLFVGTPCEVSGLLNYLEKYYENLIVCDFVCLGANSPKVYLRYLNMLEKKYQSKVKKVWFKNKTYGWNKFCTKIEFENGDFYLQDRYSDHFMKGYIGLHKLYMRPCCECCKYKSIPRISDITLADFWGIGDKDSSLDPDKGTSLIMINSKKGHFLFNSIKENIFNIDCELKDALVGNPAIFNSAKMDSKRKLFFQEIDFLEFDQLINKYTKDSLWIKMKKILIGLRFKFINIVRGIRVFINGV